MLDKGGRKDYKFLVKIYIYLVGFFALFVAPLAVLAPLAVEGQGCAGGKCGITTTLTPNSGPTGTAVTIMIESGAYPLDGNYEIWWSKTATMSGGVASGDNTDPTAVKLAEGWNERMKQSMTVSLSVPPASAGTNYFHYIKAGRSAQMLNFSFTVTPGLICKEASVKPRSAVPVQGTGFSPSDKVQIYIDGEPLDLPVESDTIGSFTASLPIPDLMAGMRRSGLSEATVTMNIEPGTYYWRVQAVDPSGNKSKWALSPYAFQVGLVSLWFIIGISLILLIIFIMLLRAFIQRIRGYY